MKKLILLLSIPLTASICIAQTNITTNFGGYSDGTLTSNTDWGGHTNNTVSSGKVVLDGLNANRKNFFKTGLLANQSTYEVSYTFNFDRSGSSLAGNENVLAVALGNRDAPGSDTVTLNFQRMSYDVKKYRMSIFHITNINGNAFDEIEIGFDDASDTTSDTLQLTLALSPGATSSTDWAYSASVYNLDDSATTSVSTINGSMAVDAEFFGSNLYGFINSKDLESVSLTSNRQISSFTVSSIPEPQTYALLSGIFALGILVLRNRK